MTCTVIGILASRAPHGRTLRTLQLRYWRAIHAELMTHRVFSRNAGSSRAIPVRKVLAQVWSDPAGPIHWGANQAGMQARAELVGWRRALAGGLWRLAGKVACGFAWSMMKIGLHKQVANRLLEPWQYINVLVTSTEWDNFFNLRCHPDAQPEIQELAEAMRQVVMTMDVQYLMPGEWHLPYVMPAESRDFKLETVLKLSTARCARISYEPFDGNSSVDKECQRHDDLVGAEPIHASPTEHQAVAMHGTGFSANFDGWRQYRWYVERGVPPTQKEMFA